MSVRTSHRGPAPPGRSPAEPDVDVLSSGSEGVPWRERWPTGPRRVLAGGFGLVAALVVAVSLLAPPGASGPDRVDDPVRIDLHPDSVVVPRHVPAAPGRSAVAALHVEVINTGRRTVVLRSASLVPGRWRVEVLDRHQLRPGWSAVLDLRQEVDCRPGAGSGPVPRDLVLEVELEGRPALRRIDVGPEQEAYGGRLDDVLGAPGAACALEGLGPLPGPIGDLFPVRDGVSPRG